jgi:hypothetical protein
VSGERSGKRRYGIPFAIGLAFSIVAWAVARAFGEVSWSVTADWAVGLIGLAFSFSLLTGVNLGLPPSIRNLDRDAGSLVSTSGGLSMLVFALTLMFVGPFVSALLP